jgi:hypothetical protein
MNRVTVALLPIALFCVAAKGGCWGDDSAPIAPTLDSCASPGVCFEPNIPVGCHLGEATCVDGIAVCPPVICPDAGATDAEVDASCIQRLECSLPVIPVGCSVGQEPCVDGVVTGCPPITCPDAGVDAGAADGGVVTDGGGADAGNADDSGRAGDAGLFTCDSGDGSPITCDGRTQACKIVEGGAYPGIHAPACVTLPPSCQAAPTCSCVVTALSVPATSRCTDQGGDFTVTEQVP